PHSETARPSTPDPRNTPRRPNTGYRHPASMFAKLRPDRPLSPPSHWRESSRPQPTRTGTAPPSAPSALPFPLVQNTGTSKSPSNPRRPPATGRPPATEHPHNAPRNPNSTSPRTARTPANPARTAPTAIR